MAVRFRWDAFISYSHKDAAWVREWLLPELEKAELKVCVDFRDFEVGKTSLDNMEKAVRRSRATVIVLTTDWVASEWAQFEAILAQTSDPVARRSRMIPLLLKPCVPRGRIAILTYVDMTDAALQDAQLARVVAAIRPARRAGGVEKRVGKPSARGVLESGAGAGASRGNGYPAKAKPDQSMGDDVQTIVVDAKDASAIASRGETYYQMHRYPEALEDFSRAIELDPNDANAIVRRALTLGVMGRFEEMKADLVQAMKIGPYGAKIAASAGDVFRRTGHHQLALMASTVASEAAPHDADAFRRLGEVLGLLGCYQEALKAALDAEEIRAGSGTYLASCMYARLGKTEEALLWLEKTLAAGLVPGRALLLVDNDLASVRGTERFRALVEQYRPA